MPDDRKGLGRWIPTEEKALTPKLSDKPKPPSERRRLWEYAVRKSK